METRTGSKLRRSGRKNRSLNSMLVYDYALRCAIRAYLEQTSGSSPSNKEPKKDRTERHSIHMGMGMLGSLTDVFGEDGGKSDKLTREIVRGLLKRVDKYKTSKDLTRIDHEEKLFLAVLSQFQAKLQKQRYKPTGSVNDLVVQFLQTSQIELKKSTTDAAAMYEQLNQYMSKFAEIVIQTVQEDAPSSATPELMERLNGFVAPVKKTRSHQDHRQPSTPGTPVVDGSIEALERFPMVITVQNLFQVSDEDHRKKLQELQPLCTDAALLVDLKKCINNVHTNQSFPGRREDFPDQQAYENWQRREVKQLTELMNTLMLMKPNLALSSTGERDVGSSNMLSGESGRSRNSVPASDSRNEQAPFAFIPNDPRSYFRMLMSMCIDYDTDVVPENERAKTSVLSQQSDELLRECWRTWRLSAPFRAVLYLEFVKARYDEEKLDLEDVKDSVRALDKVIKENDPATWAINDRESLIRTYEGLNHTLLHELEHCLSNYWKVKPDWVYGLVAMLDKIYENPAYQEDHSDPLLTLTRLEETVEGAAVSRWRTLTKSACPDGQDTLEDLLPLADKLIKELSSISTKKFTKPIKGVLDVRGIVMARHMPLFTLMIGNWAYSQEAREAPVEVTFELYHKVLSLKRLYDQYGPKKKAELFKVESWFLQHARRWLATTHAATPEWVTNAIKQDEFKMINETTVHSSSIVDLFSMFHQAVDFVQSLQWPNEPQRCRFLTSLAKVIAVALEQYTEILEGFVREEFEYQRKEAGEATSPGSLFDMARYQLTGGQPSPKDEIKPHDVTPEVCIMINDIEAARSRLDRLYQMMDVDEIAERMREFGSPTTPERNDQVNFLYTIRIVRAENLLALDNNGFSDPYVVLEINKEEIARTRTVYKSLTPRWDQTFDICLNEREADVLAIVYDEDVIGSNGECGSVWFKLSPKYYDDYQTHDFTLPLHPQGKLQLRISMVGEKDDIQFWFVRAFRTLKRAENDAASLIVDQMGQFMRYCLSRRTLDKLLRREKSFFSSFSSKMNKQVEPSIQDCENAIAPLLDYLEKNLKTLNDNLSETNMQLVIVKIWNEVLSSLEAVLRPPMPEQQQQDVASLDEYEEHVILKWLELLKIFFNGGEDGDAVPLDKLENAHYKSLLKEVSHQRDSRHERDSKHLS
ncbi:hypothetical protein LRAMOSA07303 [Lichtheimia ramosa]|uniref:C2 domain-containing protein n=1 Tax=Lichtheimia ramosa TaxID=688394 RepID=A0A077WCK3_9FUNG|nr:hypothetical protein LRAMOSA07303 [Lichtheimia ramosa]